MGDLPLDLGLSGFDNENSQYPIKQSLAPLNQVDMLGLVVDVDWHFIKFDKHFLFILIGLQNTSLAS